MIDTIANLLFRCPHRRLTRPMTPASKAGVPSGETYVVCLDCGKQFSYDLKVMRMGRAIEPGAAEGVLPPNLPKAPSHRVKYALLGSALPLLVLLGKGLTSSRSSREQTGRRSTPETSRGMGEKK
jgi:hypothetical protein